MAEELNRKLYEALQQTAINAFGTVPQRLATHLLRDFRVAGIVATAS